MPKLTGTCRVLLALDIGYAVDLGMAETRLASPTLHRTPRHKRREPEEAGMVLSPLRLRQTAPGLDLGGRETEPDVDVAIFDFGAVALNYTIPIHENLDGLVDLACLLYDNPALFGDARRRAKEIFDALGDAIERPLMSSVVEDYVIFQIAPSADLVPSALLASHGPTIARVLRAERDPMSDEEIDAALSRRIAYSPTEVAVIDWFAAFLVGSAMDDERTVIEQATVELLELRLLDAALTKGIHDTYGALGRSRRSFRALTRSREQLDRLATIQLDNALLHEGVDNALKLWGDDYLARVYRLVAERFHFDEWDASIARKLNTLQRMYEKLSDASEARRMEVLEWIIILLIAVEIVLGLTKAGG